MELLQSREWQRIIRNEGWFKNMISIGICDDDNKILEDISVKVRTAFECHNIQAEYACYSDPRVLMEKLTGKHLDVLFLDIDMPYFNGMDIAGFVNAEGMKTMIVFVTSHDALVYQTFQYRPFGFIRKTHIDEELDELVGRIKTELIHRKQELTIQKGQELLRILISEIIYVESEGNYLNINLQNEQIRIRETMSNLEKELEGKAFIRCHKGYLINSDYVAKLRTSEVDIRYNGGFKVIPIGRSYEKEVRRKIMELIRE